VVVEVGLTDIAPPPAAMVRLLPLVPVIVIPVAFWAVTVKTEELPLVIVVGLPVIVTVGGPDASPVVTVILTLAERVPPAPVAVAVYVVVEVGLTDIAPPVAFIVRLLPLVPVIVIDVALLAVTVKTEKLPLVIVVGLPVIVTVGAGVLTANAGTAHGRSIERTQQKSFMTTYLTGKCSLPRAYWRKQKEVKIDSHR